MLIISWLLADGVGLGDAKKKNLQANMKFVPIAKNYHDADFLVEDNFACRLISKMPLL